VQNGPRQAPLLMTMRTTALLYCSIPLKSWPGRLLLPVCGLLHSLLGGSLVTQTHTHYIKTPHNSAQRNHHARARGALTQPHLRPQPQLPNTIQTLSWPTPHRKREAPPRTPGGASILLMDLLLDRHLCREKIKNRGPKEKKSKIVQKRVVLVLFSSVFINSF